MPLPTSSITSVDDYSPITVGDTLKPLAMQFWYWNNQLKRYIPQPLEGLTISMKMLGSDGSTVKICTAAWVIDDALNGKAFYPYNPEDVDTADTWTLYIELTDVNGKVGHADPKTLKIVTGI